MYHLDNTSGVPEMPEPKDTQTISTRWFGESQEQGGISWPGADWFNIVQAELINILNEAGISPNKATHNQVAEATKKLFLSRSNPGKSIVDDGGVDEFRKNVGIPWTTLETLGGGVDVEDNGPALQKFFDLCAEGVVSELRLGRGEYSFLTEATATVAHTIRGAGSLYDFNSRNPKNQTVFYDKRPPGAADFLIRVVDSSFDNSIPTTIHGFAWEGLVVRGVRENNNSGIYIRVDGFSIVINNVTVINFGKTGVGLAHANDGCVKDLAIFGCGGYVDGVVYYGLDFYCANYSQNVSGSPNLIRFYSLHIESCRYSILLNGMELFFLGGHIEVTNAADPAAVKNQFPFENSPTINVAKLRRMCHFSDFNLTSASWKHYVVNAIPGTNGTAAEILAAIPAFIGSTYTNSEVAIGGNFISRVVFDRCNFWSTYHTKYLDFYNSNLSAVVRDCHFESPCFIGGKSPMRLGVYSKFTGNTVVSRGIQNDASAYASLINGVLGPAVQFRNEWFTLSRNEFLLVNSASYSSTTAVIDVPGGTTNSIVMENLYFGFSQLCDDLSYSQIYGKGLNIFDPANPSFTLRLTQADGFRVSDSSLRNAKYGVNAMQYADNGHAMTMSFGNTVTKIISSDVENYPLQIFPASGYLSFAPAVSNYGALGSPTYKWSSLFATVIGSSAAPATNIYSQNALTVISDETHKAMFVDVPDELLDAWENVQFSMYKMKAAIAEKGEDKARWHVGWIAQHIRDVLTAAGLDWTRYGLITYEKWDAQDEVMYTWDDVYEVTPEQPAILIKPAGSELITPATEAGEVYMLRLEECLIVEAAYQRRRLARLEAAIAERI
ncbi:hypothetical protein SB6421_02129 [Klebsiella huaxiensis]|uniref:tail fiber domain-containing protein n=1 Tax=Klebsiella huaxiensis TaxID=2153354 RepID=UPI00115840DC|nr:tail fiber domain-containing protein [Klebsiella huaxiensis]VUT21220.1 hypothetical protein SB6421_02129 [Klebsiella huaxiensis]